MFFDKRCKEADRLILNDIKTADDNDNEPSVINVNIATKEQLYSTYGYSEDKLNGEFGEYVFDEAKRVPIKDKITVRIHTNAEIDVKEATQTFKKHYRGKYSEAKKEVKRIAVISAVMTILGIIALTALILINHFTDNFYLTTVVEIAAWVFIWEAVDYFFLQRPVAKAKCVLIQRIYLSDIEICGED